MPEDLPELDLSPDCMYYCDLFVKCVEICKFIAVNVASDQSLEFITEIVDGVGALELVKSERRYVPTLKSLWGLTVYTRASFRHNRTVMFDRR